MENSFIIASLVILGIVAVSIFLARLDFSNREQISELENEAYNIFNLIKNLVDENGVIQIRKEPDFGRYGATCYRLTLGNSYYLHICFHDEYDRNKIWVCYKKQDTTIYSHNVRKEMENYIQTLYRDTMKKVLS